MILVKLDGAAIAPVYQSIYKMIQKIPKGRVATYGQIARLAGIPGGPRRVGYALRILPDNKNVPWHRVVNARGEISRRWREDCMDLQYDLLRNEGIVLDDQSRIPLNRFQWQPVERKK